MMAEDDFKVDNTDLVYSGRGRKRPPGASDLVQRIYGLLYDHPEGMTRDEIWEVMREGWLETDVYRAYDQHLVKGRQSYKQAPTAYKIELLAKGSGDYGTDAFKQRAQRWAISSALAAMVEWGTARREGLHGSSRWFAGRRPQITKEGKTRYYAKLDVEAQRNAHQADTQAHVRREQVKARLLGFLNDPKIPAATARSPKLKEAAELIRLAYEHLSGR